MLIRYFMFLSSKNYNTLFLLKTSREVFFFVQIKNVYNMVITFGLGDTPYTIALKVYSGA